ncbi:hypothetical protein [Azospirillum sp.]|uniref:hypothetical protein n=1 Tax=Azospirillum sp. TaxID=34012 RepID=UPI002D7617AC|nr:hypothetical protein [Azospirillum sp.]HYD66148.1 hypothetical protein [Azospirillum sp.]
MGASFAVSPLILSAICVAERDGNPPMTADEIAFMLELPREFIDPALDQLVRNGSIVRAGDHYRYDKDRSLTASELAEIELLHDELQAIVPLLEAIPPRLDS